jgi:enterochelin esterase-like enzyme
VINPGSWTVVSTTFLTALAGATVLAWAALVLRRNDHRRSKPRAWLSGVVAVGLTLTLVADSVNSYFSYLPNVSDVVDFMVQAPPPQFSEAAVDHEPGPGLHGELSTLVIPDSTGTVGTTHAWVWLPPQYFSSPAVRLPVVYLFHGSPGVQKDWFHGGAAEVAGRELAAQSLPVIEVAPQMSRGWLDDSECVDGVHLAIESHLFRDVIPAVDQSLRTVRDRTGRIFAGMSAGGYCALNLGLRHRDIAATILDYSGFTGPTHQGGPSALFGKNDPSTIESNTPASYASALPPGPSMRVWLDCGASDHEVLRQLTAIAPVLRGHDMTVELHVRPGNHTYSVWRPALRESLRWALTRRG